MASSNWFPTKNGSTSRGSSCRCPARASDQCGRMNFTPPSRGWPAGSPGPPRTPADPPEPPWTPQGPPGPRVKGWRAVQDFRPATARWATNRRAQKEHWNDGVPPVPDYAPLDSRPWLHGPATERGPLPIEDQPEDEDSPVCIPLCLQAVAESPTPEELHDIRSPEQRLREVDVPDILFQRAVASRKGWARGAKKGYQSGQQWRQPAYQKKLQQRWRQQRKQFGEAYQDRLIPQRARSKGTRMAEAMAARLKRQSEAQSGAAQKRTPGTGRPQGLLTGQGASHAMQDQPGHW